MRKQIIREKIEYPFDWTYGVKLEKIKEDIAELEKLGVTDIDIEGEDDYGSYSVKITAFKFRPETKEELKARIDKAKAQLENQKARDLKILQELKAKYEQ